MASGLRHAKHPEDTIEALTLALEGKDSPPQARAPKFSIRSQPLVVFFEKLKVVRAAATGTSKRSAPASPAAFFNIS